MVTSEYSNMELLRFTTAGSVDDGKSTLIGRLLYDSKSIFKDQLDSVKAISERLGNSKVNLALLTDGLRSEREQGITIDVAYRYFSTPIRKFIIADTPGHIEYTRNMVTGASTATAAVILVDARNGVVEQTKRHSYIASLLQIPDVILAVNKMDLVSFSEGIFNKIIEEYSFIVQKLNLRKIYYIPISALDGDNVVKYSKRMLWYEGDTLLHLLETIPLKENISSLPARFPIQYVIRPQTKQFHDYRAYAGRVASGTFKVGDLITVLPSYTQSIIKAIDDVKKSLKEVFSLQSVAIRLNDDIDASRGDMIVKRDDLPIVDVNISLMVCWLNRRPLSIGTKYIIRHTTDEVLGVIKEVSYKVDISTMENIADEKIVRMNDIAQISIRTSKPLKYDLYFNNRVTGSLIFIDGNTFETVGAGMIIK